jgi:anti-anti-sigma factor
MELRKGVLFIRPCGKLNKHSCEELEKIANNLINNVGIRYMIINLESLEEIDKYGIRILTDIYKNIINNEGIFIICGNNYKIKKERLYKIGYQNISELRALKMVNI